jgi:hypothetical protein
LKSVLIGPSLDLGLQNGNNYFGIDYNWNFFNEPEKYFLGGSGFKWLYSFHLNSNVALSPGVNIGFWYAEYYQNTNAPQRNQFDGLALLYGGLTAKLFAGNNHVSFTFEQSLLFGTSIAYMGRIGLNIKL